MSWPPATYLPAGHALRAAVARALALMGLAVVVFVAFTVLTTQVHSVRSGSPWQDDPYDAVVSFTELFVPGLATLAGLRALLWRTSEPLPIARVDGLLRAAKAAAVLITVTVATDLVALAVQADHELWNHLTFVSIVALTITGVTVGAAVVPLWRTHRGVQELLSADERGDWLADLPPLAAQLTHWMPARLRGAMLGLVEVIGRWPLLPGHLPGITGGAVLLLGGAALAGQQAVQEGQPVALFALMALLTAGGTYAGLAIVNHYLHLAAVPLATTAIGKAARHAFVLGCLTLPIAAGFRDQIWNSLGIGRTVDTPAQFWLVTFGASAVVAAIAFLALLTRRQGGPGPRQDGFEMV